MKNFKIIRFVGLLSIALIMLNLMMPGFPAPVAAQEPTDDISVMEGPTLVLIADEIGHPHFTPPPDNAEITVQSVNITANFNPATCPGSVTAWTQEAKDAFNYALGIWSSLLNGNQTIVVQACYRTDMGAFVLGSAGANDYYRNFTGGMANTWYPCTLAHQLADNDLNGTDYEINANFNANFDWYYGTDGNPGTKMDFVSVVLHEVGHGLGFAGSMVVDDGNSSTGYGIECNNTAGVGCWGSGTGDPFIYDRFTEDGNNTALLNYSQNSTALGNALLGQVGGGVYFDGSNANAANGGSRVKLYTPSSWSFGSSYSHLDEIFNNTPHALMTYSIGPGEAEHHPGSVTLGMFKDMGWDVSGSTANYWVYLPVVIKPAVGGPTPGYWSGSGNEFYVTTDRAYVDNFAIFVNVTGCGSYKITHLPPEPISNDQFSFSSNGYYASGSFPTNTTAGGTTGLNDFYIPGCGYVSGGPWSFNATWQSSSQPTLVPATVVGESDAVVPVPKSNNFLTAATAK